MKAYKRFYRIAFSFHEKYAPYPKTAEAWENAIDEMGRLSAQEKSEFLNDLLFSIYREMAARYRANKNQ